VSIRAICPLGFSLSAGIGIIPGLTGIFLFKFFRGAAVSIFVHGSHVNSDGAENKK
jgi:hypothetical protein